MTYSRACTVLWPVRAVSRFVLLVIIVFGGPCVASAALPPRCNGVVATIFVNEGVVVGGSYDGQPYQGTLKGTMTDDVIVGTVADDLLIGRAGNDVICGGAGDDTIIAGPGRDILDGTDGVDTLDGGGGSDLCLGGEQISRCESLLGYGAYAPLMRRNVLLGPLYATGSREVSTRALREAAMMLAVMLRARPDVVERLRQAGAVTAVFASSETVCDLDYFGDLKGLPICSSAPGGLGGVPGRPATGCSEKNVLRRKSDPYGRGSRTSGENVCVHELAHTIMNVGLTDQDREAIHSRYVAALAEHLWDGDSALQNADEFFAEMSQAYFCANPDVPAFLHTHGVNCSGRLAEFDSASFALVDSIYKSPADLR